MCDVRLAIDEILALVEFLEVPEYEAGEVPKWMRVADGCVDGLACGRGTISAITS
jgi:hypothetical protein